MHPGKRNPRLVLTRVSQESKWFHVLYCLSEWCVHRPSFFLCCGYESFLFITCFSFLFFLLAFFLSPLLLLLLLLCQADIAKSGEISIEDFRAILLRSKQFNRKEVDEIFDGLDIGSSGLLSYTDFTAAALDR